MKARIGRALLSAIVLTGAALPVASHANDDAAVARCVENFIKEVIPTGHSVEIRNDDIRATPSLLGSGRSIVNVVARGERNGKEFGRAMCVIDRNGSLVSMQLRGSRVRLVSQDAARYAG